MVSAWKPNKFHKKSIDYIKMLTQNNNSTLNLLIFISSFQRYQHPIPYHRGGPTRHIPTKTIIYIVPRQKSVEKSEIKAVFMHDSSIIILTSYRPCDAFLPLNGPTTSHYHAIELKPSTSNKTHSSTYISGL